MRVIDHNKFVLPATEAILREESTAAKNGKATAPPPFGVMDVRQMSTYAAQKIDWIVDRFIAAGTITIISGESGSGKSTLASAACSAIERGVPFAGLVTRRRPVLFLDRENPLSIVCDRFERLGIADSPNFIYWGGWAEEEAAHPGGACILEWVQACEPKPVIVVDSLVSFLEGDENSSTEIRKFFHPLRKLADAGATVIVIHHSGKAETSKDYRGSSDIKAAVDVGYIISNLGESAVLSAMRVRAFKARFSVMGEVILRYTADGFKMGEHTPFVTVTETLQQLLIDNPGVTATELETLASAKGIAQNKTRQFLKNGVSAGSISTERGAASAKHHTWNGVEGGVSNLLEDLE